jgi:rubrerythrin
MKKIAWLVGLSLIIGLSLYVREGRGQMGPGMMGPGYGYGHGMGPGMMGGWVDVPDRLPTPKNAEWVQKLREVLALEKKSYVQYTADAEKYNAAMPYMMVIPQEEDHVQLIERLFLAYGLKADGKPETALETKSLKEAFELCAKMEQDLIPRYVWLVQNAQDRESAQILNHILIQTRWHLAMFEHALGMGGYGMGPGMMRGRGWGPGIMGPGMRGWGMGPGMMGPGYGYPYGPSYRQPHLVLDEKKVKEILENYLKSTRNPNLKLGKIEDKGNVFEAEILTQKDSLVDKILVDKYTGWLRSAY